MSYGSPASTYGAAPQYGAAGLPAQGGGGGVPPGSVRLDEPAPGYVMSRYTRSGIVSKGSRTYVTQQICNVLEGRLERLFESSTAMLVVDSHFVMQLTTAESTPVVKRLLPLVDIEAINVDVADSKIHFKVKPQAKIRDWLFFLRRSRSHSSFEEVLTTIDKLRMLCMAEPRSLQPWGTINPAQVQTQKRPGSMNPKQLIDAYSNGSLEMPSRKHSPGSIFPPAPVSPWSSPEAPSYSIAPCQVPCLPPLWFDAPLLKALPPQAATPDDESINPPVPLPETLSCAVYTPEDPCLSAPLREEPPLYTHSRLQQTCYFMGEIVLLDARLNPKSTLTMIATTEMIMQTKGPDADITELVHLTDIDSIRMNADSVVHIRLTREGRYGNCDWLFSLEGRSREKTCAMLAAVERLWMLCMHAQCSLQPWGPFIPEDVQTELPDGRRSVRERIHHMMLPNGSHQHHPGSIFAPLPPSPPPPPSPWCSPQETLSCAVDTPEDPFLSAPLRLDEPPLCAHPQYQECYFVGEIVLLDARLNPKSTLTMVVTSDMIMQTKGPEAGITEFVHLTDIDSIRMNADSVVHIRLTRQARLHNCDWLFSLEGRSREKTCAMLTAVDRLWMLCMHVVYSFQPWGPFIPEDVQTELPDGRRSVRERIHHMMLPNGSHQHHPGSIFAPLPPSPPPPPSPWCSPQETLSCAVDTPEDPFLSAPLRLDEPPLCAHPKIKCYFAGEIVPLDASLNPKSKRIMVVTAEMITQTKGPDADITELVHLTDIDSIRMNADSVVHIRLTRQGRRHNCDWLFSLEGRSREKTCAMLAAVDQLRMLCMQVPCSLRPWGPFIPEDVNMEHPEYTNPRERMQHIAQYMAGGYKGRIHEPGLIYPPPPPVPPPLPPQAASPDDESINPHAQPALSQSATPEHPSAAADNTHACNTDLPLLKAPPPLDVWFPHGFYVGEPVMDIKFGWRLPGRKKTAMMLVVVDGWALLFEGKRCRRCLPLHHIRAVKFELATLTVHICTEPGLRDWLLKFPPGAEMKCKRALDIIDTVRMFELPWSLKPWGPLNGDPESGQCLEPDLKSIQEASRRCDPNSTGLLG